jgi:hypothetical protein
MLGRDQRGRVQRRVGINIGCLMMAFYASPWIATALFRTARTHEEN